MLPYRSSLRCFHVRFLTKNVPCHRFISHTVDGCPDGHMQISELSRPLGQGFWCGTSWGSNVYYSESSAVTLLLRVFNLTKLPNAESQGGPNAEESVLLRLSYRFLRKSDAVLRYGPPYRPNYLGKAIRRSFCDRYFDECDKRICKLQSPNFPGIYPRNLTCQYKVHQSTAPAGKIALIRIKQDNPHLIYVKDKNSPNLKRNKQLVLNSECDNIQDYFVIHDGNSTSSPVLLRACKGGTLSAVTASSNDILIQFKVSPYDFPFQDSPRRKIYGFQFDVEIMFVDIDSTAYIRRPSSTLVLPPMIAHTRKFPPCTWEMKSSGRRSGYIQAPEHSILPGITCTWRLAGGIGEVVWLSFLHYRHVVHEEIARPAKCMNTLTIHDGGTTNSSLIVNICEVGKYPKVCGGGISMTCSPEDSYISKSSLLTITLNYADGTTASHVEFLARFEFVRRRQWGHQMSIGHSCDRVFGVASDRLFASPRDVFLFGRGGNRKLFCKYTFNAGRNQIIVLKLLRSRMGDDCRSEELGSSRRYECSNGGISESPSIWIIEELWPGVTLKRACLCNVNRSVTITSYTSKISLVFNIPIMTPRHDYTHYFFEGEYDIIGANPGEQSPDCDANNRRYSLPHGNLTVGAGVLADHCASLPRLISPPDGGFLFLRVNGFPASAANCGIGSRINIYGVGGYSPLASICPEPGKEMTHVFSNGWDRTQYYNRSGRIEPSRELIVEYTGNYSGRSIITWISVWRPVTASLTAPSVGCPHRCPEISACLPEELWCDRVPNCPSKADETAAACGILIALPWLTFVVGGTMFLAVLILLIAVVTRQGPRMKGPPYQCNDFEPLQVTDKKLQKKRNKKSKQIMNEFDTIGSSRSVQSNNFFTPVGVMPPGSTEDLMLPPDGAS